ncbi:MAG: family 20 glycosylhydrolase [bacterium]|nr:family 20 glycosylhydrolase [bacterium]
MNRFNSITILLVFSLITAASSVSAQPVRGLHLTNPPGRDNLELFLKFIREALPKEGVNTLVLEFDYSYQFESHPELASPGALGKAEVKQIVEACRDAKVELIPQINCLGHQSWSKTTSALLTKYPEFDETPGKYPDNEGIYCRSWCPYHPEVHKIVFELIDELAAACEAKAVHVGMDEVFILADKDCPRCKDKSAAEAFAYEINTLHDHLASNGLTMWMWSDRFIDGKVTGIGEWEASENGTAAAIDMAPNDIVMCDWHYEAAHPTAMFFAVKGFPVVSCPWRKPEVALGQLQLMDTARMYANNKTGERLRGMLHTTWCGTVPFMNAYYNEGRNSNRGNNSNRSAIETVNTFKVLFEAMRKK